MIFRGVWALLSPFIAHLPTTGKPQRVAGKNYGLCSLQTAHLFPPNEGSLDKRSKIYLLLLSLSMYVEDVEVNDKKCAIEVASHKQQMGGESKPVLLCSSSLLM